MLPEKLKYAKTHEWALREDGSDIVTVGLSDYAVEQLGDIVYIDLPAVGGKVTKESELCALESVKAASDLYAPVTGDIVEVNENLAENLELFKSDAYGQAWIVRIKADNIAELETLMNAEDYKKLLEG